MKGIITVLVFFLLVLASLTLTHAEQRRNDPKSIPAQIMGLGGFSDSSNIDRLSLPKRVPGDSTHQADMFSLWTPPAKANTQCPPSYKTDHYCKGYGDNLLCCGLQSCFFDVQVTAFYPPNSYALCFTGTGSGYAESYPIYLKGVCSKTRSPGLIYLFNFYAPYVDGQKTRGCYTVGGTSIDNIQGSPGSVVEFHFTVWEWDQGGACWLCYNDPITKSVVLPDSIVTTEDTPNPEELGPQDNCASSVGF